MDTDRFNWLCVIPQGGRRHLATGIERIVREGKIEGTKLKLRMILTAENTPLNHVVEETIDLH